MTRLPQVLRNVRVADRQGLDDAKAIWDAVRAAEAELAGHGPGAHPRQRHRAARCG